MTIDYDKFPTKGDGIRAHTILFQRCAAAQAGYCGVDGMTVSWSDAATVAISSGHYRSGVTTKTYAGGTLSGFTVAGSGKHRYDLVVMDCADDTIKRIAGTEGTPESLTGFLNNITPAPPELTGLQQYLLAIVLCDSTGIKDTTSAEPGAYCTKGVAKVRLITNDSNLVSDLDLSGSTRGTIIMKSASAFGGLAPGALGTVVMSNGSGSDLTYSSTPLNGWITI